MYIIIIGDLCTGIQTVHGPFEDHEHANQWANMNIADQFTWIIITVYPPGFTQAEKETPPFLGETPKIP